MSIKNKMSIKKRNEETIENQRKKIQENPFFKMASQVDKSRRTTPYDSDVEEVSSHILGTLGGPDLTEPLTGEKQNFTGIRHDETRKELLHKYREYRKYRDSGRTKKKKRKKRKKPQTPRGRRRRRPPTPRNRRPPTPRRRLRRASRKK